MLKEIKFWILKIKLWILCIYYQFKSKYKTTWVEDIPDNLEKKTIYILGGKKYPFQVIMQCPRSCKKKIFLNISHQHKKRWHVIEHSDGTISLTPSIWIDDKCNCHYWFKKGKIFWCELPNERA